MTTVLTILQLLSALAVILVVLIQSGKKAGLSGAFGGISETFMSKNKGKSLDVRLAKMTKWLGLVFVVLTIALSLI